MLQRFKEFKHDWEQPYLEGSRRAHLQEHVQGHRVHPDDRAPTTARASRSSATTSATSTRCAHFLDRGWSSRRSSSSRVFGILGGIGPHPEDVAAHEAHGRPAVRRPVPLVACSAPGATRCRSPRSRPRWAATCASAWRTGCGSARASSPKSNAEQVRAGAPDHRGAGPRDRHARRARVEGGEISVHYDPLIAKLIASADTREAARRSAIAGLRSYPILGVRTNVAFLIALLEHPRFISGDIDTGFVDSERAALLASSVGDPPPKLSPWQPGWQASLDSRGCTEHRTDPWATLRGWRG